MAQGVKKYFHIETCFTLDCANLDRLHGAPNDRSHFWSPLNQRWDATDLNPFWACHVVGFIPLLKEWLFWPFSETLTNIYLYQSSLMVEFKHDGVSAGCLVCDRSACFYKPPWNKMFLLCVFFFFLRVRQKSVWTTQKCFYFTEHRLLSDDIHSIFLLIDPRTAAAHSSAFTWVWTQEDRCHETAQKFGRSKY